MFIYDLKNQLELEGFRKLKHRLRQNGPKPLQKPHPPILLGGSSPNTLSRIVNYADGWLPVAGFGCWIWLEQLEKAINSLREGARKANKDPSKIRVFVLTYPNVLDFFPFFPNFLRATEIAHDRYH
jgi:alkanesulfonate monooxygenase SsuD/methylene tetrahydromethanopterin reductase-like flavin-dependent oxidoreductase (luciferase family)